MQEFLNDYGMVWVGRSGAVSHDSHVTSEGCSAGNMWSPNSSLVTEQEGGVDFDAIVRNVRQLNILAGEGSSEVTRTPKGAKLKVSQWHMNYTVIYFTPLCLGYWPGSLS